MLIAGQLLIEDASADRSGDAADTADSSRYSRESAELRRLPGRLTGRCRIEPGMVRVEDGRIAEVILGECSATADLGDPQHLICPGFIDAHLHLPQGDMIGAHGMRLLDWLNQVTFPTESLWQDSDLAERQARRQLLRCLSVGTTGIGAYATIHAEATRRALMAAEEIGIRGVIGQVLMDRQAPQELCRPATRLIEETAELLDRFPPGRRTAAAVTPRFAITSTPELLAMAGKLAEERGAIVQTHLAETADECREVERLFAGRGYVEVYEQAGLVSPRSIFGHGIHLDADDRRKLAERGAVIAHCPVANSFLRSGTMRRAGLIQSGVGIVLGSDVGAGYELSMVRVARAMIEAATSLNDPIPEAAEAWHAITAGNADRLGWSDAGRLEVGAPADLLVIRPQIAWLEGPVDPLARLMFNWDDRWLSQVLLRGQLLRDQLLRNYQFG